MKLLELFEQSGKTVAVAFGRMNPPTIGHQKVVDAILKQKADAHFLFVSQTHQASGKNKTRLSNPLPFDTKLGFIQKAFPNIDIGDTSVSTAIGMLQLLEKQGFENVIFVAGSDRVEDFNRLFNKQNGIDYNFESINVVSSGARDPDAEGAEGMSASKMRAAAISNDFESFKTGLPTGLQSDANEVFLAVRQGLEPWIEEGLSEAPIEMNPEDPMDPMIYGHEKANPGRLKYRMMRAAGQFKDLAARVDKASPTEWQTMIKQFDELKMNVEQIKHGLEELAKQRRKGGVRSRGIDPMIDSVEESCKYGRYYCSTDKKWKCRTGAKQVRSS